MTALASHPERTAGALVAAVAPVAGVVFSAFFVILTCPPLFPRS